MAKSAVRYSDVLETEWSQAVTMAVRGIGIIIVSAIILYFARIMPAEPVGLVILGWIMYILGGVGLAVGVVFCVLAAKRGVEARKMPTVAFPCPYCGAQNTFLETPTTDFTCENCDRQVYIEIGEPVPVRTIVCQACRAEHKVAVTVQRYVCDRCNRPLRIVAEKTDLLKVSAAAERSEQEEALLHNYDVLLVAVDKRRENELAFKLQNLLVVNLNEARRLMHTVSSTTPLVVAANVPERKAEAIRRQLQELGATATQRPTTVVTPRAR